MPTVKHLNTDHFTRILSAALPSNGISVSALVGALLFDILSLIFPSVSPLSKIQLIGIGVILGVGFIGGRGACGAVGYIFSTPVTFRSLNSSKGF